MATITQDIKISCQNSIIKGSGAKSNDGHPWRNWKITLAAMDGDKEIEGKLSNLLDHVEYILHPTFEEPRRVRTEEPYVLQEKGWGEFDMRVVLYFRDNIADPQVLLFDLNFAMSSYSITHRIEFPNASAELQRFFARESNTFSTQDNSRKGRKKPMGDQSKYTSDTKKMPRTEAKIRSTDSSSASHSPMSPGYNDMPTPSTSVNSFSPNLRSSNTDSVVSTYEPLYDDRIFDTVNDISDVYYIDPVHRADISDDIREQWDIPKINMTELTKRIFRLTPDQMYEFQQIILENMQQSMDITVDDNNIVAIDFYTLGKPLLEKLWDYVADMGSDDDQSFASLDFHASDLELESNSGDHSSINDDTGEVNYEYGIGSEDETYYHNDDNQRVIEGYNTYTENDTPSNYFYENGNDDVNNADYNSNDSDLDEPGFRADSVASEDNYHHHPTNGYSMNQAPNGFHYDTAESDEDDGGIEY